MDRRGVRAEACLPLIMLASEVMKAHGWRVVVLFQFVGKEILVGKCLL